MYMWTYVSQRWTNWTVAPPAGGNNNYGHVECLDHISHQTRYTMFSEGGGGGGWWLQNTKHFYDCKTPHLPETWRVALSTGDYRPSYSSYNYTEWHCVRRRRHLARGSRARRYTCSLCPAAEVAPPYPSSAATRTGSVAADGAERWRSPLRTETAVAWRPEGHSLLPIGSPRLSLEQTAN